MADFKLSTREYTLTLDEEGLARLTEAINLAYHAAERSTPVWDFVDRLTDSALEYMLRDEVLGLMKEGAQRGLQGGEDD